MTRSIRRRTGARGDLVHIFRYYAQEAGLPLAQRFLTEAGHMFTHLADMPKTGTRYHSEHPALGELRFSPLSAPFNRYVVFYRPLDDGIEIARILHSARDIQAVLLADLGIN